MTIQWFPGHMAKARREVEENLLKVDLVLELLDARLPFSSRNPLISELTSGKPRLVLLNKADMADPAILREWEQFLQSGGLPVLAVNSQNGDGLKQLIPRCQKLLQEKREALRRRGIRPPAMRGMILGIPNVGKSTLINRLAARKATKTGDRPGITTQQQWIKVGSELQLLDTPGILWPRFEDKRVGFCLAASGAIRDEILPLFDVALYVIEILADRYPEALQERYRLSEKVLPFPSRDEHYADGTDPVHPRENEHFHATGVLYEIGRRRGCLAAGGEVDTDKAAELLLRDLRSGKLGRICLEQPQDVKNYA